MLAFWRHTSAIIKQYGLHLKQRSSKYMPRAKVAKVEQVHRIPEHKAMG